MPLLVLVFVVAIVVYVLYLVLMLALGLVVKILFAAVGIGMVLAAVGAIGGLLLGAALPIRVFLGRGAHPIELAHPDKVTSGEVFRAVPRGGTTMDGTGPGPTTCPTS